MVSIFFVENTVLTNENGVYVVSLSPDVTKNKGIKSKCEISETYLIMENAFTRIECKRSSNKTNYRNRTEPILEGERKYFVYR